MNIIVSYPLIVKKYSSYFESCFTEAGYEYFQKAISGLLLSENKTIEGINRLFVLSPRNQSSFNRFFNNPNQQLDKLNTCRLSMLSQNPKTCLSNPKELEGTLIIDNTLLRHYGTKMDGIYNLRDYVYKGYRWCHDLVTLHYSNSQTDYPVYYRLWDPPDWEEVARAIMKLGMEIKPEKWDSRKEEPQKWRNYMRSRYKLARKKYPQLLQVYKTKNHIAADLLRKYKQTYPSLNLPVALDSGFTSSELCGIISEELSMDYVGSLRDSQIIIKAAGEKVVLKDFILQLKTEHFSTESAAVFHKVGYNYKGEKQYCYVYCKQHRIKGFNKKQKLLICFSKADLSDTARLVITNRTDWYASDILRIRRHRWPVETYHQESKAEGLDKYQVRNHKAISAHIAFVVVAYSMLRYAQHDESFWSEIQAQLQGEYKEGTLPFLRRLMKAEGLVLLLQYLWIMLEKGETFSNIVKDFTDNIAYS